MKLPLKGIKVLDFTTLLPGPYATQLLADMGAEVIRIESTDRPDMLNAIPPILDGVSAAHATINRGKQSLALNLKKPQAQEIVHRLLNDFDVIVEQFRPGVMTRLGFDYDLLRELQPKLIYCSITGYGQTGPLKDRAGHDINFLALSGLASYSGTQQRGPVLSGFQIADIAGGSHHAVMSILAAVIHRQNTGEGQYLDISMSDAALALNCITSAAAHVGAPDPSYETDLLNGGSFYDYYRTADDRYLSIGCLEPQFLFRLLEVLELHQWADKLSAESIMRPELSEAIAARIADHPLSYWCDLFAEIDCCVEPVLDLSEALALPHFTARHMTTQAVLANGDIINQVNPPFPFKTDKLKQAGQPLGQQSWQILLSLGYSEQQIAQWVEMGVVGGGKSCD